MIEEVEVDSGAVVGAAAFVEGVVAGVTVEDSLPEAVEVEVRLEVVEDHVVVEEVDVEAPKPWS